MNAALIVMTILGCNDSGTDCHYIATASERWPTVAMCDAVSEDHLPRYANQPYPVLISVCQNPQAAGVAEANAAAAAVPESRPPETVAESAGTEQAAPAPFVTEEVSPEEAETLAGRAIQRVRNVLPTTEGVKTLMVKPVRLVEDGYSWVARRFDR
ncbi:hypothetical protein N7E02_25465 [Aliirhizobium terrae]|uniref:hypothetical protein n=1 Tax=Terrirhizobium terrae TaxID=2926709 RepID=UPI002575D5D8|nr:hypothetical protein [Rhizobium sp. CC-CFT758]WJH39980.1 hypothetical protein N7E02_25465 [Rhizobium sp. CC-CFT758]